jgi:hypothetical protein
MSLLNKLKFATGVGLNAQEHYQRAYEKGVLLGPQNYGAAMEMFRTAAERFQQAGETEAANRAMANRHIYEFLANGSLSALLQAMPFLQAIPAIEEFGTATESFPASELCQEIHARLLEGAAFNESSDLERRVRAHRDAALAFQHAARIPRLRTYRIAPAPDRKESPLDRFFLHEGWAAYHEAVGIQAQNPDRALEHYSTAMNAFKRANLEEPFRRAESLREAMRIRRCCWVCHREMQGQDVHFTYADAAVPPYVLAVLQSLNEAPDTIRPGAVAVCTPCHSMIRNAADAIAQERVQELEELMNRKVKALLDAISALERRISYVESLPRS